MNALTSFDELPAEEQQAQSAALKQRTALDHLIPPGYRLSDEARMHLQFLAAAPNRAERRRLEAFWRKNPAPTFVPIGTPSSPLPPKDTPA